MENTENNADAYQVIVCNIAWSNKATTAYAKKTNKAELPAQMSLDIPKSVLAEANKSKCFNDVIETFCYNLLTRKYGHEVNSCQIWLPLS